MKNKSIFLFKKKALHHNTSWFSSSQSLPSRKKECIVHTKNRDKQKIKLLQDARGDENRNRRDDKNVRCQTTFSCRVSMPFPRTRTTRPPGTFAAWKRGPTLIGSVFVCATLHISASTRRTLFLCLSLRSSLKTPPPFWEDGTKTHVIIHTFGKPANTGAAKVRTRKLN